MSTKESQTNPEPEGFDIFSLATDDKASRNGVWVDLGNGCKALIARWGNPRFTALLREKLKASRVLLDGDDELSQDVQNQLMSEVMARTILLDLSGPLRWKGALITQYSPALGDELFTVGDFRDKIKEISEDAKRYRVRQENADVK